jgi:hypothetical protein
MSLIAKDSTNVERSVKCSSLGRLEVEVTNGAGSPIPVTVVSGGGVTQNTWFNGLAATVADNVVTTIITHTVVGSTLYIEGFITTGELDAEYTFYIDNTKVLTLWSSEQQRNIFFNLTNAIIGAVGTIFDIKVKHYHTGKVADFNATLIGFR